jgi:rSAM/selenodomain-associated transferase 1
MDGSLVIFSRFPRLGRVKTRLEPVLGQRGCLELHRALLLDTIERTRFLCRRHYLYLSDSTARERARFAEACRLPADLIIRRQTGTDLGEKLWEAYRQVVAESKETSVVFLGADSPTVPRKYIRQGLAQLARRPVVVGPAEDGGYYLIGLSQPKPELFSNLDWGTGKVLEQTLQRLRLEQYTLLPTWFDVDDGDDLARLRTEVEAERANVFRHTRLCLRRLVHDPVFHPVFQ